MGAGGVEFGHGKKTGCHGSAEDTDDRNQDDGLDQRETRCPKPACVSLSTLRPTLHGDLPRSGSDHGTVVVTCPVDESYAIERPAAAFSEKVQTGVAAVTW